MRTLIILISSILAICISQVYAGSVNQSNEHNQKAHPLDPLTTGEIKAVIETLHNSQKATHDTRFGLIERSEPKKRDVKKNAAFENHNAYVLMYDWKRKISSEAVVNFKKKKLISWKKLKTRQPPNTYLTIERIEEIVFLDPRWKASMLLRGIELYDAISLWPDLLPYQKLKEKKGQFIISVVAIDNNARSAEGRYLNLNIKVDLTNGEVIEFSDNGIEVGQLDDDKTLIPKQTKINNTDATFYQAGNNFEISNTQIEWENWRFRFSVNPRRGLEIYDVNYIENGKARNILYRASLSEIMTPYGDPEWYSWYPSDEGDLNFANYALVPTTDNDVLPGAVFQPAVTHDAQGNARTVERSIAVYEKYSGLRWRHYKESRRAKDLIISSHFMVDNYDYVVSWVFKQNGSIVVEITLTGMINYGIYDKQRKEVDDFAKPAVSNTLVAPDIYGPIHQHFFNFRLDFDIDGGHNSVAEVNSEMLPKQPANPTEEWFAAKATVFAKEKQAIRQVNPTSSRKWKIFNANLTNRLGQHPSYFILPKDNAFPLTGVNSPVRKKAGFINAHLWVTPYSHEEMYAAGKYLGADYNGEGLPQWVQANRDIKNKDIVVWYTMGTTHLPRPEDWPVMPSKTISFEIMPFGFFTQNPALH